MGNFDPNSAIAVGEDGKPVQRGFNPTTAREFVPPSAPVRVASDIAKSFKAGADELPGTVTGLADIPTALAFGDKDAPAWMKRPFTTAANALGEATGFQPGKWAKETKLSDEANQSQQEIDKVWEDPNTSAGDVAKAYLTNPAYIANQVSRSLPSTVAGGFVSKVPGLAGAAARVVGKDAAAAVAGGVGEGAVQAGQQMQQGEELPDQRSNAIAALGSGAVDAAITSGAGALANKLGFHTLQTRMAGGKTAPSALGRAGQIGLGAADEAVLQELPQSMQEQAWQNWAEGKPLMEGVVRQGVEGALSGAVMGAGANVIGGSEQASPVAPPAAPALALPAPVVNVDAAGRAKMDGVPSGGFDNGQQQGVDSRSQPVTAQDAFAQPLSLPAPGQIPTGQGLVVDEQGNVLTEPQADLRARMRAEPAPITESGRMGLGRNSEAVDVTEVQSRSVAQRLGIDPAGGPLQAAAAIAVDTGAHQGSQDASQSAQGKFPGAIAAQRALAQSGETGKVVRVDGAWGIQYDNPKAGNEGSTGTKQAGSEATQTVGSGPTAKTVPGAPAPAPAQATGVDGLRPFPPQTGSLGVPRADMPQITPTTHGPLTQFLAARGITHEQGTVDPRVLKPTQGEYDPAKVRDQREAGVERNVLVSSDGYILDGTHQWLSKYAAGQPIKSIKFNAPIDQLLPLAKEFPSAQKEAPAPAPSPDAGAAPAPVAATPAGAGPESRAPAVPAPVPAPSEPAADVAPTKKPLAVGRTPQTAESVTVKDGIVHIGEHEALHFDTGEPIRVADGATDAQVRAALKDGKVLSTRQRFFGGEAATSEADSPKSGTEPAKSGAPAPEGETPERRKAQDDLKSALSDLGELAGKKASANPLAERWAGMDASARQFDLTRSKAATPLETAQGLEEKSWDALAPKMRDALERHWASKDSTQADGTQTETPELIGKGGKMIDEGGKPFQNRVQAERHRAEHAPQGRVVKSGDGFAVKMPTGRQLDARKKAGERLRAAGDRAMANKNPLLHWLGEQGGLHPDTRSDLSPDRNPFVKGGVLFRSGGENLDTLAERAAAAGFLPAGSEDANHLYDLVAKALRGERVAPMYAEGEAQAELDQRLRTLSEEAPPVDGAYFEPLAEHLEGAAEDLAGSISDEFAAQLDALIEQNENASAEAVMRGLGFTDEEISNELSADRSEATPAPGAGRGARGEAQPQGPPESGQAGARDEGRGQAPEVARPAYDPEASGRETQQKLDAGEWADDDASTYSDTYRWSDNNAKPAKVGDGRRFMIDTPKGRVQINLTFPEGMKVGGGSLAIPFGSAAYGTSISETGFRSLLSGWDPKAAMKEPLAAATAIAQDLQAAQDLSAAKRARARPKAGVEAKPKKPTLADKMRTTAEGKGKKVAKPAAPLEITPLSERRDALTREWETTEAEPTPQEWAAAAQALKPGMFINAPYGSAAALQITDVHAPVAGDDEATKIGYKIIGRPAPKSHISVFLREGKLFTIDGFGETQEWKRVYVMDAPLPTEAELKAEREAERPQEKESDAVRQARQAASDLGLKAPGPTTFNTYEAPLNEASKVVLTVNNAKNAPRFNVTINPTVETDDPRWKESTHQRFDTIEQAKDHIEQLLGNSEAPPSRAAQKAKRTNDAKQHPTVQAADQLGEEFGLEPQAAPSERLGSKKAGTGYGSWGIERDGARISISAGSPGHPSENINLIRHIPGGGIENVNRDPAGARAKLAEWLGEPKTPPGADLMGEVTNASQQAAARTRAQREAAQRAKQQAAPGPEGFELGMVDARNGQEVAPGQQDLLAPKPRAELAESKDDSPPAFSKRADKPVALPTAIIGTNLGVGTSHPDYEAAKAGDAQGALRLAQSLVSVKMLDQVRELAGNRKPLLVPVVAEESTGRNKIPRAVAEVLAHHLALETADELVQSNRPQRTQLSGLDRIFAQPEFDGPIEPGKAYILVDDTLTQGATFAALASHIRAGGGEVLGAVALTGKGYSATIQPSPDTLTTLQNKYGDLEPQFRAATGYGFDALTQSEARYLANFEPAETVRARIAEEGRRAGEGGDPQDAGLTPQFRRGGARELPASLSHHQIQQAVSQLTRDWLRRPEIHVIDSLEEGPPAIVREAERQRMQGGSDLDTVHGFHYRGDVYIMAPAMRNFGEVREVLFHEALGHFGLRGVFGERLKPILAQLVTMRPQLVAQKAADYGLNMKDEAQRLMAAEEVLAELAATRPDLGWVRRAVAAIRSWLREHGLGGLRLTDDEVIRNYILPARGFVERGRSGAPSFARNAQFSKVTPLDKTNATQKLAAMGYKVDQNYEDEPGFIEHQDGTVYDWNDKAQRFEDDAGNPLPKEAADVAQYIGNVFDGRENPDSVIGEANDRMFEQRAQPGRTIQVDGQRRPIANSNGQPVGRNFGEQRNFWRWFGDSMVTDTGEPGGRPTVMYHGSYRDLTQFDRRKSTEWRGASMDSIGSWFSDSPSEDGGAGMYATGNDARIYPVYLSITRPKVYDTFRQFLREMHEANGKELPDSAPGLGSPEALRARLVAQGYDGIALMRTENGKVLAQMDALAEEARAIRWSDPKKYQALQLQIKALDAEIESSRSTEFDKQQVYIAFEPTQIKSAIGNDGSFDPANPDVAFSKVIGNISDRQYSPEQERAMRATGLQVDPTPLADRLKAIRATGWKTLYQGVVDQFAPIKELSKDAYALLRLSKGSAGAFEVLLNGGRLKLVDGVYDFDETKRGGVIQRLFMPLQGEHHDFLRWVAANRAEQLSAQDREHLFSPQDIAALKTLADGTLGFDYTLLHGPQAGQTTRDRAAAYADSLKTFNEFHKNTLDMAEASGLIDGEGRSLWEKEFYVPFYREFEDSGMQGMNIKSGVVRQQAFKKLKGGTQKLHADLLENTLANWAHLLDAAAKNRAAKAALEAMGATGNAVEADEQTAQQISRSLGKRDGVVWFMDAGRQRYFFVDDPHLMASVTALSYAGMNSPVMKALGGFKHALTVGVTASPFFKVRNLIRDSVSAIASAPLSANPAKNIGQGWKDTAHGSDAYFRLLAGGGTIHFGTMYEGSEAKRVQALVEAGVDASTILDSADKVKVFWRKIEGMVSAYQELGNRGEAINRAALYQQLRAQGASHAEASLQARDLLDFSMQGSFATIRFLTQVVPFMNARIQGLAKLGRAAKEDPARFSMVLGAAALLSIGLAAGNADDDDWKKREDWDRNNYWWFKFAGQAYRIPKPFEIGAMATLAERGYELWSSPEMTGTRFRDQVLALASDNLSFNPIPQLVKPMMDVYANKDSFTERPIETTGMERLKSSFRYNDRTTMAARGASSAMNAVAGVVGKEGLSPVQIDHLIQGYFGWLGSFIVSSGDVLARPATSQPTQAAPDYWKTATGGMVANLADAPSRYVSQMYTQSKEIERAYGTWKQLLREGKVEQANAFREANTQDLAMYHRVEGIKRGETFLSQQQKRIEAMDLPPDVKRERLREIAQRKDSLARGVAPGYQP